MPTVEESHAALRCARESDLFNGCPHCTECAERVRYVCEKVLAGCTPGEESVHGQSLSQVMLSVCRGAARPGDRQCVVLSVSKARLAARARKEGERLPASDTPDIGNYKTPNRCTVYVEVAKAWAHGIGHQAANMAESLALGPARRTPDRCSHN